ncbi:MAG: HupE/UreJ family protein [Myxacorys californica WJT36-NPBG1]|jgi:urease accessory protein|nr:HupE/UreJ family protein [Myxacorys californica WJT36-NPBG1]
MNQQKLNPVAIVQVSTLAGCGWLATLQPAAAHHLMDGKMPSSGWEGFLSGLAHPVIGLDHLASIVAIGLLSTLYSRGWRLPIFFLISAMMGTGVHLLNLNLPATESVIALSVIAFGAILVLGKRFSFASLASLFAIAGLFHGYAYGEAIVGAEASSVVAYLIGFTMIQAAIALLTYKLSSGSGQKASVLNRSFGLIACIVGAIFLATSLHFA